jgi:hypothetical protein
VGGGWGGTLLPNQFCNTIIKLMDNTLTLANIFCCINKKDRLSCRLVCSLFRTVKFSRVNQGICKVADIVKMKLYAPPDSMPDLTITTVSIIDVSRYTFSFLILLIDIDCINLVLLEEVWLHS